MVPVYARPLFTNSHIVSNGALSRAYHFDSKAVVEEYVRELGIPASFFMPGFYMPVIAGMGYSDTWLGYFY